MDRWGCRSRKRRGFGVWGSGVCHFCILLVLATASKIRLLRNPTMLQGSMYPNSIYFGLKGSAYSGPLEPRTIYQALNLNSNLRYLGFRFSANVGPMPKIGFRACGSSCRMLWAYYGVWGIQKLHVGCRTRSAFTEG